VYDPEGWNRQTSDKFTTLKEGIAETADKYADSKDDNATTSAKYVDAEDEIEK
jgi:hypothetical protein